MKSLEDIAMEEIKMYMTPYPAIKFAGHNPETAVKKVKLNRQGQWDKIIDRSAIKLKGEKS